MALTSLSAKVPPLLVDILSRILDSFGVAEPIIATVIAIVLGRYIWNWRSKPILVFSGSSTRSKHDYDTSEWDNQPILFRIHLENWGLSAAENCKPEMVLRGSSDTHKYELLTPLCWSEGDNPARQTVNRGENIGIDVFYQGETGVDKYLRFPSEKGWPAYSNLNISPKPSFRQKADGATASVAQNRTETAELMEVEWDQATIEVTAENADAVEADIDFTWKIEDPDREDVSLQVTQSHGSALHYWRFITNGIKSRLPHISFYEMFY